MHFVGKVTGTTQGVVMFAGTALATWAVAEVSYRLFESRFLSLKARYVSQTAADNRSVIG
jgi:peptidoglycan/LPS O-acetylase OafA/YrhL